MRTLYRTVSIVMVICATLITNWSVNNIEGLLDLNHMVAAFAALSIVYLALNFKETLPPTASIARVVIVLLSMIAQVLWFDGASMWMVLLIAIWASTIFLAYDISTIWWQRLHDNRRTRQERRLSQQVPGWENVGLSIMQEPEPVA